MRVLVADDEHGMTDILKEAIRRKGHQVDVAHDGRQAMDLLLKSHYELAFLDFTMPEVTGFEVIEYIRSNNLGTRTVLMTAYPFVEDSLVKASGIDEYLPKPIHLTDIERILDRYKQ